MFEEHIRMELAALAPPAAPLHLQEVDYFVAWSAVASMTYFILLPAVLFI